MKPLRAITAVFFTAAAIVWAGEKSVTLPEMIQDMKEMEQADGVFRAKLSDSGALQAISLSGQFCRPEHLRALAGAPSLQALSTGCLPKTTVQEMVNLLPAIVHLQKLNFTSPDAQAWNLSLFKTLRGLRELRQLRLGYASLPVGSLRLLADLPNLEVLELPSARQITADELRELQRCPKLTELNLHGAAVDRDCLSVFLTFPSLKYLDPGRNYRLGWILGAALKAKGITLCQLVDHRAVPTSPWHPWME